MSTQSTADPSRSTARAEVARADVAPAGADSDEPDAPSNRRHPAWPAARPRPGSIPVGITAVEVAAASLLWSGFSAVLQRGALTPLTRECSIQDYLTDELGLDPAYVRDRIATVFLDGMVVDDLETAVLRPGSTLTLSAAMPGLVGATLRRGGFYAKMRSEISLGSGADASGQGGVPSGMVRVKLFNLILREVGPALLGRGIVMDREQALASFGEQCDDVAALHVGARVFTRLGPD